MAKQFRLSISLLMAIVLCISADIAIVKSLWYRSDPSAVVAMATLPMINILLLALPKMRRWGEAGPFWLGFEAIGWAMVLLVALFGWFRDDPFFYPLEWIDRYEPFPLGSVRETALLISFCVILYTPPQVLAAVLGGRLLARYRVVIEHRPEDVR